LFNTLAAVVYVAWIVAIFALAFHGRRTALENLGTPEAKAQWDAWREAAKSLNEQGPVQRRVPKSAEPPGLVLMRDYFGIVLTAGGVFGTVLFLAVAWPLRGVLTDRGRRAGDERGPK
jgi:hypothetical protein